MRLIEQTERYIVDSEEDAIKVIQNFKKDAETKGYVLGKSGYDYKTKKSKGDIIGEEWIVTIWRSMG